MTDTIKAVKEDDLWYLERNGKKLSCPKVAVFMQTKLGTPAPIKSACNSLCVHFSYIKKAKEENKEEKIISIKKEELASVILSCEGIERTFLLNSIE